MTEIRKKKRDLIEGAVPPWWIWVAKPMATRTFIASITTC